MIVKRRVLAAIYGLVEVLGRWAEALEPIVPVEDRLDKRVGRLELAPRGDLELVEAPLQAMTIVIV